MKNIVYTIMKKNIFIITICCIIAGMTCSMQANAQARPDSVSVHAGQKPLVELLTDEQKETIKYLTVTGKLLDEDYKYIRESLIIKLKELNLRDADIDTIPENAFKCDYDGISKKHGFSIVLPKKLKYLSDCSLCAINVACEIIITGNYPDVGKNVFCSAQKDYIYSPFVSISDDNPFLKEYDLSIFSLDGSILYHSHNDENLEYPNEKLKIIAACALEYSYLLNINIPETVDSIGDRAFANSQQNNYTGYSFDISMNCRALTPPRLGKDVFIDSDLAEWVIMYVPEESLELYKAADGWKDLHLEGKTFPTDDIVNIKDNMFKILDNGTLYQITASQSIKAIEIYDVKGRLTNEVKVNRKEVSISKATLAKPYAIVKLTFGDDTYRIIKLIP